MRIPLPFLRKKDKENSSPEDEECNYPIELLRGHIGKEIVVKRVNQGEVKEDRGILTSYIYDFGFYLRDVGREVHRYLIDWYNEFNGKLNAVISIRVDGEEIYRNEELEKLFHS